MAFNLTVKTDCPTDGIPPGGSCTLTVTVNPDAVGAFQTTVRIDTDDPGSPYRVNVLGIGEA